LGIHFYICSGKRKLTMLFSSNVLSIGGPWDGFPHHSTRLISCNLLD
jgi:hypothetical protein